MVSDPGLLHHLVAAAAASCILWQDEVLALKEEEGPGSGGEDEADNSGDDSDASSHLALDGKKNVKKKVVPKQPKPESNQSPAGTSKPAGAPKPAEAGPQADAKAKASLEQAVKALAGLKVIDANGIFKNSIKDADIAARLKKASQSETSLSQICATLADGSQLKKDMEEQVARLREKTNTIVTLQDAFGRLRAAKAWLPELRDSEFHPPFCEACKLLDADSFSEMLTLMGRKVSEARFWEEVVLVAYT